MSLLLLPRNTCGGELVLIASRDRASVHTEYRSDRVMADETWTQERQLSRPGAVTSCAWSPDGMRLASVGGGRVGVWDVYSPITGSLPHHPNIQHTATVWCPLKHA